MPTLEGILVIIWCTSPLHNWDTRGSGTLRGLSKVTQPIRDSLLASWLPHPAISPLQQASLVSRAQENTSSDIHNREINESAS